MHCCMILATYPFRLGLSAERRQRIERTSLFPSGGNETYAVLLSVGFVMFRVSGIPFGTGDITTAAVRSYIKYA